MINYKLHTLPNGLRVAASRDRNSKLAAVNLLYCVGARNEHPDHTGFAHLFEHLMFRGTRRIPDFDTPVQMLKILVYKSLHMFIFFERMNFNKIVIKFGQPL